MVAGVPTRTSFLIYLSGLAAWFVALGIQTVLFPWLAAVVLALPPAVVGVAQMALTGPAILFLLYAGAVVDRGDPRSILLRVHLLASLPPLVLAIVIYLGRLSVPLLLVYGVAMGTIQAFAVPARDSILPRVVRGTLPRAVALAVSVQFACQMVGIAAAFLADRIGAPVLLVAQACAVIAGATAVLNLPPPDVSLASNAAVSGRLAAMLEGLRAARRDTRIWPVLVVMTAIGIFYGGTFVVTIPIAVRDAYGRTADGIAMTNFAFWAGTILTSFLMAGIAARIHRPGAAMVGACLYGVVVLVLIGTLPAWPLLMLICFLWGLGAGITMTQGRTIVQSLAATEMRGRMLALFQFGFLGGTPIGALIMGGITQVAGVSVAMWVAAAAMAVILSLLMLRSSILTLRLDHAHRAGA